MGHSVQTIIYTHNFLAIDWGYLAFLVQLLIVLVYITNHVIPVLVVLRLQYRAIQINSLPISANRPRLMKLSGGNSSIETNFVSGKNQTRYSQ